MGALSFGHLPTVFIPAGPMQTGTSNESKSQVRKAFAKGEVGRGSFLLLRPLLMQPRYLYILWDG